MMNMQYEILVRIDEYKYEILDRIVLYTAEGYCLDVTRRDITKYSQKISQERSWLFTTKGPRPHAPTSNYIYHIIMMRMNMEYYMHSIAY